MADLPDLTLPLPAPDLVARVNATENRVAALEEGGGGGGTDIKIGGTAPADGWWIDVPEPEDIDVTATGPTWTDDTVNGGGTWTTPTETGITYSPASGTASPGQAVTVTATAQVGYHITGVSSWQHDFPVAPPAGASDDFDRPESALGGMGVSSSGHAWSDPDGAFKITTGGRAMQGKDSSNHKALLYAGITDVTVAVDLWNFGPGNYGILARADLTDETYYHARSSSGSIQLWRFVDGVATQLGSNQPWSSPANGDTLSLTVQENGAQTDLTVTLRGVVVIAVSDTEAGRPTAGIYAGLRSNTSTSATFDNFAVTEP